MARRLRPCAFGIEARCRRHVEPLSRPDPRLVVYEHEGRGLVAGAFDACRAVGFVAEDEIEGRRAVVLRPLDEAEGVVGAEDDRHDVRRGFPEGL